MVTCVNCTKKVTPEDEVHSVNCDHFFCLECVWESMLKKCPKCQKAVIISENRETTTNTITNAAPPPLDPPAFVRPSLPAHQPSVPTPPTQGLQHFSFTCPGLHGATARTRVERTSFAYFLNPASSMQIVIPLFQRSYCWNTATTVPAWWRDTAKPQHSCGKLVFKLHDGAWWCLDGQQRVTTTMLLIAAARDAILRLQHSHPDLQKLPSALDKLESVLFVDVAAAREFATAQNPINEGQRLTFSRLVPSYCDRRHFFELIIGGCVSNGTDAWLAKSTKESIQYNTKHYFDTQFQNMLDSCTPLEALDEVISRATGALNVQLMMVEPQSDVNLAQVYQWLQESSLLSMGALLFNPSPGMKMHACDLARNLFLAPWTGDTLDEQEKQHELLWLKPIEVPCENSPSKIDWVLSKLVEEHIPSGLVSETEKKLLVAVQMPGFVNQDLSGLVLYARVLTLWEHSENAKLAIADVVKRQQSVAIRIMRIMGAFCAAM